MDWITALGAMFTWLGGETIGAAAVRMAIGYGISNYIRRQQESANDANSNSSAKGVRQQISPATDNKLPVAYGDSYFSGTIVDVQLVNDNKEMVTVIALCEKTGDIFSSNPTTPGSRTMSNITIDDIYLNNQKITFMADGTTIDYTTDDTGAQDTNAHKLVGIYLYGGDSNTPMLPCITGTSTPIPGTLPTAAYTIMPGWTSSHTLENTIFAVVKMNYDPKKGVHNIPALKFHVRNTLNKPGDVLHDYSTNNIYGAGLTENDLDNATFTALNTYSDESITLGTFPAQPRYRINGLMRTTEPVMNNMSRIASSAGSTLSYDVSTGKWAVLINKAGTKTLDFNDSNIIGQIAVSGASLDTFYNKVEVQFPYVDLRDQFNFIRFDLPESYRNENEADNMLQLNHELVNNPVQATVLANLDLRQSREDLVVTFTTDYSKYNVQIGDIIGLTNSVYGWTDKLFRVIRIKRNESDNGELTLSITGQTYNPDVYTVENITDFTPTLGPGHSIPSFAPITTPLAPTVSSSTLSSQPSIIITGVVPAGIVTEMEFWYTKDTAALDEDRNYYLLGTMRSENSGPFTTGDVSSFKTVLLASGTYYFKVRAANSRGTSSYSPPSIALPYTYIQAPDALKYETPAVDNTGAAAGGLSLGLMAGYLATKLNWFGANGILSGNGNLESIFGISSNSAAEVNTSVSTDVAASVDSKAALAKADEALTTADSAAASVEAASNLANEAKTDAANAQATADEALALAKTISNANVTVSTSLTGHVFPSLFGTGTITNTSTIAGIFTHDHLVFAGSQVTPELLSNNIITKATTIKSNTSGYIQTFYTLPDSNTFAKPPAYNQSITDKFEYDSRLSLYYATATYTSGNLDAQSWSNWTLLSSANGVTGTAKGTATVTVTYSNPLVNDVDEVPYIVDEIYQTDGVGNVMLSTGAAQIYDPFKPNVAITTTTYAPTDTRNKELYVTVTGTKSHGGGANELVIFGTSVFGHPTGTPFANNTAFGHIAPVYVQTYPFAISFTAIVNNGSRFVGIGNDTNKVYWSDNGADWTRVSDAANVSDSESWINDTNYEADLSPFAFLVYDGTKFIAYNKANGCAWSTDGKVWTSVPIPSGVLPTTTHVYATNGKYIAVSPKGVQFSTDGLTWAAPIYDSSFGGRALTCATHDGSKFIIGSEYYYGEGSAFYTTIDGTSFTKLTNLNNPNAYQVLTASQNDVLANKVAMASGITAAMPI